MMYFLWISLATTILEESISNTNTPTNNKKDTCSRQQLEGKNDRSCLSKETWKRSQIWMIKIGGYSNVDVEMEITPNISEDFSAITNHLFDHGNVSCIIPTINHLLIYKITMFIQPNAHL